MNNNTAIFPGSFDPITLGHIDVINSGLKLFEKIIVAIGKNEQKQYMFDVRKRSRWIKDMFKSNKKIIVKEYNCLTVDFCVQNNAKYIIRGLRTSSDFEYEMSISLANQELNKNIETIFLPTKKKYMFISSAVVKEILSTSSEPDFDKRKIEKFIPEKILHSVLLSL